MNDLRTPNPYEVLEVAPARATVTKPADDADESPGAASELRPQERAAAAARAEQPRFRPLAVVVGLAIDIVGAMVASIGYLIGVVIVTGARTVDEQWAVDTLSRMPHLLILDLMSFGFSMSGGFVNGVIARHRERAHGAAQVAASYGVRFGLALSMPDAPEIPLPEWLQVVHALMVIPAVLLGAELAALRRRRREGWTS